MKQESDQSTVREKYLYGEGEMSEKKKEGNDRTEDERCGAFRCCLFCQQ